MLNPTTKNKMNNRIFNILLALALILGISSCGRYKKPDNSQTIGTMTMVCDNTFQNVMEQEIDVFEYQYPDAHVLANFEPQGVAIDSLLSLNTRTIVISRDLTDKEREYLKSKRKQVRSSKIAVDAVALIVNPENPVGKLTLKEVADILSGESTKWNDIWPTDKLGDIAVIFDHKASSLVTFMRDSLLDGRELGANVYAQGSIPEVFKTVKANKNAIGVLGVSWITSDMSSADMSQEELASSVINDKPVEGATLLDEVKVLSLYREGDARAYKPYQENIFNGTYPLFRQIYMITTGPGGSLDTGFYTFVTGNIGQKIIMKTGILPARASRIQVVELVQ